MKGWDRIHKKHSRLCLVLFLVIMAAPFLSVPTTAAPSHQGKKILIVMSYDPSGNMEKDMQQTFDDLLRGAVLQYFWLDAKKNSQLGRQKAEEAYQLFQDFKPDVVVAANDNAQELFVVPYLRNKVSTPVVFAGVNDDAGKYGFPADNVTGVLEKKHYRESISFAQLIDPRIKKIGVIYPADNLSQRKNIEQINREKKAYGAQISQIVEVSSVDELKAALVDLNDKADAMIISNPTGLRDQTGGVLKEMEIYKIVRRLSNKPTIGVNDWEIEAGILCGVIKSNNEQASLAVEIINNILAGQAIKDIAVKQNKNGRRFLNLMTLKKLGLTPVPQALLGTKIVSKQIEM